VLHKRFDIHLQLLLFHLVELDLSHGVVLLFFLFLLKVGQEVVKVGVFFFFVEAYDLVALLFLLFLCVS